MARYCTFSASTNSSTISLAYWCIGWAKHRQKKAAVKLHMVANVRSRLPHFCLIDKAKDHDSKKAEELLARMPYLLGFENYFNTAVG